jgi:hypothetical protein
MVSTSFHRQVTMDARPKNEWLQTANLNAAIVKADEGKALSYDGTTPNSFKLAADGDVIIARLDYVETDAAGDSTGVGTVAMKFIEKLPIKTGETMVVGGSAQGAGSGEVKPLTANHALNYVVEIRSGFAIVVKI